MKKEYLYGAIWGFVGFFLLNSIGIHNIFIQVAIIIAGIVAFYVISQNKK